MVQDEPATRTDVCFIIKDEKNNFCSIYVFIPINTPKYNLMKEDKLEIKNLDPLTDL